MKWGIDRRGRHCLVTMTQSLLIKSESVCHIATVLHCTSHCVLPCILHSCADVSIRSLVHFLFLILTFL